MITNVSGGRRRSAAIGACVAASLCCIVLFAWLFAMDTVSSSAQRVSGDGIGAALEKYTGDRMGLLPENGVLAETAGDLAPHYIATLPKCSDGSPVVFRNSGPRQIKTLDGTPIPDGAAFQALWTGQVHFRLSCPDGSVAYQQ